MKLRLRGRNKAKIGALVVALSLPGVRAFAQTEGSSDEPEEKSKPAESALPPMPPPAPPPPVSSPEPAAYVGFAPPPAPLRVDNSSSSIQFGVLGQPAFEMGGAPDDEKMAKNLFIRRFRLIVGGTLFKYFEFFFDTDVPNLFKQDPADTMAGTGKNYPGMTLQDAYLTFRPVGELIKVDAGFMLPPLSHNGVESAAKLYGGDYFVNTFRRNVTGNTDPFKSQGQQQGPVGRDAGVQLRALLLNRHIDARVGMFQGLRLGEVPAAGMTPAVIGGLNIFRVAARLQINLLDGEPGFFYQGTYHGAKKIVSIGGFIDYQDPYKYFGGDLFVDLPLGPGILTAQADVGKWDGGIYRDANNLEIQFAAMGKATVYLAEVGYLIGPIMLSPIARFERLDTPLVMNPDPTMPGNIPDPNNPKEDRYGGGLAFWPYGHNSNLKAFFTRVHRQPSRHDFNVLTVQWQVYFY
ncbi:MAG TPA: hypothetical protein VN903_35900 [Polyangia bacterium]|jgi:hypothetical protein|nr:hypothetical protein [Polyangia bacterium]